MGEGDADEGQRKRQNCKRTEGYIFIAVENSTGKLENHALGRGNRRFKRHYFVNLQGALCVSDLCLKNDADWLFSS